jgi:hypothetical protein
LVRKRTADNADFVRFQFLHTKMEKTPKLSADVVRLLALSCLKIGLLESSGAIQLGNLSARFCAFTYFDQL